MVDIEAADSDTPDDDPDDEDVAAEHARQAAESVPLRRFDEVCEVQRVANEWEVFALEQNRRMQERDRDASSRTSRKRKADAPAATSSRKRTRPKSPSPPPNTLRAEIDTAKGMRVIYLPVILGETVLERETRIYDASEPIIAAIDSEVLKTMAAKRQLPDPAASAPIPTPQSSPPAHSSPISTPLALPIDAEWTGGAAIPTDAPTASPRSPPASQARSVSQVMDDKPPEDSSPALSNEPKASAS